MKKQALETIYMTSIQSIQYNGGNMTKEQYKRAGEIKFDIKALKDQPLSCGVSDSTRECWKKWVDDTIAKLEKEFEEL